MNNNHLYYTKNVSYDSVRSQFAKLNDKRRDYNI